MLEQDEYDDIEFEDIEIDNSILCLGSIVLLFIWMSCITSMCVALLTGHQVLFNAAALVGIATTGWDRVMSWLTWRDIDED